MSRLDSFIRRLEAQREVLNAAAGLLDGRAGPILELGLGNGRTYDHLRERFQDREIFVFERHLAVHPESLPDADHLILGDILETLPRSQSRFGGRCALIHSDIGTGVTADNAALARRLAPLIAGLLAPGGLAASDQPLEEAALESLVLPAAVPPGRYHLYRRR